MIIAQSYRVITDGSASVVATAAISVPADGTIELIQLNMEPVPNGTPGQDWVTCWFTQQLVSAAQIQSSGLISPGNVYAVIARHINWPDTIPVSEQLIFQGETLVIPACISVKRAQNLFLQAMTQVATNQIEARVTFIMRT